MSIVITGIGLTSPIGNGLNTFRSNLLEKKGGLSHKNIRYMGKQVIGECDFDEFLYQKKKARRRGTRAGSVSIFCANECLKDANFSVNDENRNRLGVFLGITEHGNVETEEEIYLLHQNNLDTKLWSPHHNPRTVANSPAGEVTLNLGITGPHFTIGAACAGGNMGIINGLQQILLGEVDVALCGGVSESPQTFGIFAGFDAQGALAFDEDPNLAIRPLDKTRKGTVISEGGCLYLLERKDSALKRGANIYAEIVGWAYNSDSTDFVLPNAQRQAQCMRKALAKADISAEEVDIINMHATGTGQGDIVELKAVKEVFCHENNAVNFTKGHIGHCMGAAGALELAGNLPSFQDGLVHPGKNCLEIDPECTHEGLVVDSPVEKKNINYILNNSFGMLGINSSLIVKKFNH